MNTNKYISIFITLFVVLFFIVSTHKTQAQICSSPALVSMNVTTQNLRCNGDNTGSISVSVTGSSSTYTYSLFSAVLDPIIINNYSINQYTYTNLPADSNYFLVIQVPIGGGNFAFCSKTIIVSQPAPLSISGGIITNITCSGGNNGKIDATVTGGSTSPYTYLWSNGETTEDISDLVAGDYTLNITDGNGCEISRKYTVTEPDPLNTSSIITNVSCFGGSNGAIDISISGGATPYISTIWSNGAVTEDVSGLVAGSYSVKITDKNNCSKTLNFTLTQPLANITATNTINNITCNGSSTGAIDITPAGGTAPYSFAWTNSATSEDLTSVIAGSYSVTITDSKSCSKLFGPFIISQNPPITLTTPPTILNANCNGASTGSISINPTGGIAPYTYLWSNGNTTKNSSALVAGNYSVTITDATSCSKVFGPYTVAEPLVITATSTITNASCNGASTGAIKITPAGGTPNYTYVWSNGATTQNISSVVAGSYSVTITDKNACSKLVGPFVISEPVPITSTGTVVNVSCNGGTNGTITLSTPTGGTAPYSYLWNTGATTGTITGLIAGNYTVTIKDVNGCSTSLPVFTITQPSLISASNAITNITCNGSSTGAIDITPAGGTAPYNFAWTNSATSEDLTSVIAGSYSVTITDSKLCSKVVGPFIISQNPPITLTTPPTILNATCNGASTGSISINPTGGTAPYTYLWSNGNTTKNNSSLVAGNYSVTIKDATSCSKVFGPYTVAEPLVITATSTITNASCNGASTGAIKITPAGGTPNYTYVWSNGATTQNISSVVAGSYSVTITDKNACSKLVGPFVISEPVSITSTGTVVNVSCNGGTNGTITLSTPTGGTAPYSYLWNTGATTGTITGLAAGNYTVTIKDLNGCSTTLPVFSITQPSLISASNAITNITCNGSSTGAIDITPAGGVAPYTFAWTNSATSEDLTAVIAGSYSVTITDSKSCSKSFGPFTITQNPPITLLTLPAIIDANCNGTSTGSISINPTGGTAPYTYLWSNGSTTKNNSSLVAGNYSVTITDATSCAKVFGPYTVAEPLVITATSTITNASCNGASTGAIKITPAGGTPNYTYVWSNGATTQNISNVVAGSYSVTITDKNACSKLVGPFVISEPVPITSTGTAANVTCNGGTNGTITLSTPTGGTAPYSYLWNSGATTGIITGLAAGNYTVTIKDLNGCSTTLPVFTLTQPSVISATNAITNITCNGSSLGAIDITPTGGIAPYTFAWTNSATTEDLTSVIAGSYSVTIKDSKGCAKLFGPFIISQNPPITLVSLPSIINETCNGGNNGAININPTGGIAPFTYLWSNGNTTKNSSALVAGNYSVTITDATSCSKVFGPYTVNEPNIITATSTITNISCNGNLTGSINITPAGGTPTYTYVWSNGATTQNISSLSAGSYSVTIKDMNGCSKFVGPFIISEPTPIVATGTITNLLCNAATNGKITLSTPTGGTSPYSYLWNTGASTADISGLIAGNYSVTIKDINGCSKTLPTFVVTEPTAISILGATTNVQCSGTSTGAINITPAVGGVGPYTYLWSNGASSQNNINIPAGTFSVIVTDSKTCSKSFGPFTITENMPITLVTPPAIIHATCNGASTGSITINPTGGVSPYTYLWSNGTTTKNSSALVAGNYSVTITDATSCSKVFGPYAINEPTAITATSSITNISCNGNLTGSINITPAGGTPNYTFLWSNAATTQNIANLNTGSYSVTILDENLCSKVVGPFVINQPVAITATTVVTNVSCNGGTNGSITLSNTTGGTAPYTYLWNNGATTGTISGLVAGNYILTIKDANNCSITMPAVTVIEPTAIVSNGAKTDVVCSGTSTGAINITAATGGVGPYTYLWSNGVNTQNNINIPVGNYNVIITDATSCTLKLPFIISEPNPIVTTAVPSNVTCNGAPDGSITVTNPIGGVAPYTYLWSTGAITQNLTNVIAGNYSVVVSDSKGCSKSIGLTTITEPASISATGTTTDPSCNGSATGMIVLNNPTGGIPLYSYSWDNGSSSKDLNNLIAGTYSLIIKDSKGCSNPVPISFTLNKGVSITGSASASPNTLCSGEATIITANIDPSYTAAAAPYSFNGGLTFQSSATFSIAHVAADTTVSVVIKDINGCLSNPLLISITTKKIAGTLDITQPISCFGSTDGVLTMNITGSSVGYLYSINGAAFQSSNVFTNLSKGTYTVVIDDATVCKSSYTITLNEPSLLTLAIKKIIDNDPCSATNNGSILVTSSGGNIGKQFTITPSGISQTDSLFTNLVGGTYTISVTDSKGCSANVNGTIHQPTPISISSINTQVNCSNPISGAIDVSIVGGVAPFTYIWNNGSVNQDLINLTAGTYKIIVTDSKNCKDSLTVVIDAAPLVIGSAIASPAILCSGESTIISAVIDPAFTGAANAYSFNGGSTFQSTSLFPIAGIKGDTNVIVVLKDINGCISLPITVSIKTNKIDAIVEVSSEISCASATDGALKVTVSGPSIGFMYSINNGTPQSSPVFSALSAGNYTVMIDDGTVCKSNYKIDLLDPLPLTLAVKKIVNITPCNGGNNGSIAIYATGGSPMYSFTLSPTGTTQSDSIFTNLIAGSYSIALTDAKGCTANINTTINQPAPISISSMNTRINCANPLSGAIDVSITGGTLPYTYAWNNGSINQDLINLTADTYKLIVTDSKNCKDSLTVLINAAPLVIGSATANPSLVCSGEGTTITAVIDPAFTAATNAYSFNGGLTYQSSSSFPIAGIKGDTTIIVVIKDINGCISLPIPVTVKTNKIDAVVEVSSEISCVGATDGSVKVIVSGSSVGFMYSINSGTPQSSPIFSTLSAGNYIVLIDDGTACKSSYVVDLFDPASLIIGIKTITDVAPCAGENTGSIAITANGGTPSYSFALNTTGVAQTDSLFTNLIAGNYSIAVTDAKGCNANVNTTINQPLPIAITSINTPINCTNPISGAIDVSVIGGIGSYTYLWNNGSTDQDLTNLKADTYKVIVTDGSNCKDSLTVVINAAPVVIGSAIASPAIVCSGDNTVISAFIDPAFTPAANAYSFDGGLTYQSDASYPITGLKGDTSLIVMLKDINGCMSLPIIVLIKTNKIDATVLISKEISCVGLADGAITVNVTGSSTGFIYSNNGGTTQASNLFDNLVAGAYTVVIDDGSACKSSYTISLLDPTPLVIGIKSIGNVAPCAGGNNGSIAVTTTGGSPIYNFTLSPTGTSQLDSTFTNLIAANYFILVTDAKGCTDTISASVIQPSGIDTSLIKPIIVDNKCAGKNEGSITLTNVSGGISPYTFTLNGITSTNQTPTFIELFSGKNTIIIKDNNSCKTDYVFTIHEPLPLLYATTIIPSSCTSADGSIKIININGGTGPYQSKIQETAAYTNTFIYPNLAPNSYSVKVKDMNGCITGYDITLGTKPAPIPYVRITDPTCNKGSDGFIVVDSVSGGIPLFQFSFNKYNEAEIPVGSSTVFPNLSAGDYALKIKDKACNYTIDSFLVLNNTTMLYDTLYTTKLTVSDPKPITASVISIKADRFDKTGIAGIYNLQGGTPGYQWSSVTNLFTRVDKDTIYLNHLPKGTHSIFVVDTNGCTATFEINIEIEFFIPNLITPNKDGKNDRFEIMALPVGSELLIANRWGNRVYLSSNYDNSWGADEDSDGVYYYELTLPNGEKFKGWIEVTR